MSVTTVRFGFVDTKMARADRKPWMMTPDRAAAIVLRAVRTRPVQVTRPRRTAAALTLLRLLTAVPTRRPPGR